MSVRRRAAVSVAVSLVAAVLLAGCSEDPEPRFEEPISSPTPSEAETSAAGRAQTPEEFIREWFAAGIEMQNSGETAGFLSLSTRDCVPCRGLAERVTKIYRGGGSIQVARQSVRRIEKGARSRTIKQYDVTVDSAPTVVTEEGRTSEQFPGGLATYEVTLVSTEAGWRMDNLLELG